MREPERPPSCREQTGPGLLFDETGPALVRWFRPCAERLELVRCHLLPSGRDGSKASLLVTVIEYEPAPFESFTDRGADLALVPPVGLFAAFGAEVHGGARCRASVGEPALRQLRLNSRHVPQSTVGIREGPLAHLSATAPLVIPHGDVAQ